MREFFIALSEWFNTNNILSINIHYKTLVDLFGAATLVTTSHQHKSNSREALKRHLTHLLALK